jgi:hypothetical protein
MDTTTSLARIYPDEEQPAWASWRDLFAAMSGPEFEEIRTGLREQREAKAKRLRRLRTGTLTEIKDEDLRLYPEVYLDGPMMALHALEDPGGWYLAATFARLYALVPYIEEALKKLPYERLAEWQEKLTRDHAEDDLHHHLLRADGLCHPAGLHMRVAEELFACACADDFIEGADHNLDGRRLVRLMACCFEYHGLPVPSLPEDVHKYDDLEAREEAAREDIAAWATRRLGEEVRR